EWSTSSTGFAPNGISAAALATTIANGTRHAAAMKILATAIRSRGRKRSDGGAPARAPACCNPSGGGISGAGAGSRPAPGGSSRSSRSSVVLDQVEPGVEGRHFLGVAVEHQRRLPAGDQRAKTAAAEHALARLAPPRVVDVRIHVRVEPVLVRRGHVPRGLRLALGEVDTDDRLDALEAVLPRHDQAQRRAVLVRQHLAVDADRKERK